MAPVFWVEKRGGGGGGGSTGRGVGQGWAGVGSVEGCVVRER